MVHGRDVPIPFFIPDTDFNTQIWAAADTEYWSDTRLKKIKLLRTYGVIIIIKIKKDLNRTQWNSHATAT